MDTLHEFRRIVCANCGMTHDVPIYCGDRFCPVCSGPRRARLRARLLSVIKSVPKSPGFRWRFITLTIPTSSNPELALDTLYQSFRRLRSRQFWKYHCSGGIITAEITRTGDLWHVHLHIIAYSRYIPQFLLSKIWKSVSPGSICDIRLLPETTAVNYVVKYVTKLSVAEGVRSIASKAMESRRLYSAFGVCHNCKCTVQKVPYICERCGSNDWTMLSMVGDGRGFEVDCISDA